MQTTLGQRLKILLTEARMSNKELATRLNLHPSSITQFVKDTNKPSQATSEEICKVFNEKLEWFLTGNGERMSDTKQLGHSFNSSGAVSGGQNLTGWGTQTSFTPQGMDLNLVASLEKEIEGLKRLIAEKDERIFELKERIQELKDQLTTK